jgi:uncharacterized protein YdaU (DUF1376 family)
MSQPWFSFWVGDYLKDTARLSTEAHGAYLLLILDYWTSGAPPDDDETLSSIARLSLEQWHKLRHKLEPFFVVTNGRWTHNRIEKELEISEKKHKNRVDAGKAGGNAKANGKQCSSNASSKNLAKPYQSQSQSQSHLKERTDAAADAAHKKSPDAELYERGKEVLGKNSGGLIKNLLTAKDGNIAHARAAIELASTRDNPREYLGAIIRGREGLADRPDRSW